MTWHFIHHSINYPLLQRIMSDQPRIISNDDGGRKTRLTEANAMELLAKLKQRQ